MEERRNPVRRIPGELICGAALCAAAFGSLGCELPQGVQGVRLESERVAIAYWTVPASIEVGKPFVLEMAACPKQGSELPARIRLDAHMPEHRHGMNYRTNVVLQAPGRFHSEGWLFHMPGRWEFLFDIGADRLTHSVRIE